MHGQQGRAVRAHPGRPSACGRRPGPQAGRAVPDVSGEHAREEQARDRSRRARGRRADGTRPAPGGASRPVEVPRLAEGVELLGEYKDSGYSQPPSLVRRADGQVIQMSALLYRVACRIDGSAARPPSRSWSART